MLDLLEAVAEGAVDLVSTGAKKVGNVAMQGIKTVSGDAEREKWINKLERYFDEIYRPELNSKVNQVNSEIPALNEKIKQVNNIRQEQVGSYIGRLHSFLGKFGHMKAIGEYTEENSYTNLQIPEQHYENITNYIADNNLDTTEIIKRILSNLFSIRSKNRAESLAIQEKINSLKIDLQHYLVVLEAKRNTLIQNREIADMYIQTIHMVLSFIDKVIYPELELVESFFQANRLKDEILAGNKLSETDIVFHPQIKTLASTPYERHYMFVKNTFMFYVLVCKIYSSPVLTRLLQNDGANENDFYKHDLEKLQQQICALNCQKDQVTSYLTWKGESKYGE